MEPQCQSTKIVVVLSATISTSTAPVFHIDLNLHFELSNILKIVVRYLVVLIESDFCFQFHFGFIPI